LATEGINPESAEIDLLSTRDALEIINTNDRRVADAVATQLDQIAQAVDIVVDVLRQGGRMIYVGAGTSGRLGVVDASEMPPTFGTQPDMIQGVIAGGTQAMFKSQEGIEDQRNRGIEEIGDRVGEFVCVGLSASGRTPYVLGALEKAHEMGMPTVFISTNSREVVKGHAPFVDVLICPEVGPEVIMGSTRMKSGTAQKMVLNMISTTAMVKLGKTYGNVMVDLQRTNEKLKERAKRIVMTLCELSYDDASDVLERANGNVKTALVMSTHKCDAKKAEEILLHHNGFVRPAMKVTE